MNNSLFHILVCVKATCGDSSFIYIYSSAFGQKSSRCTINAVIPEKLLEHALWSKASLRKKNLGEHFTK
jgi:hypothetical protein